MPPAPRSAKVFAKSLWNCKCLNFNGEQADVRISDANVGEMKMKEATNPQELMETLLNFEPVPAPVISLYLDARVNEHGKRNFLPFVRKQLSERLKTYPTQSEERASLEEDFVRIMRYL